MAVKLSLFLFVISGGKQCRTTSGDGDIYLYCIGSVIVPTTAGIEEIWLQAFSCEVGVEPCALVPHTAAMDNRDVRLYYLWCSMYQ